MELLIKRSQKEGGMLGGKVHFVLAAKVRMTDYERNSVKRYGLGDLLVYSSDAAQQHAAAAQVRRPGVDYSNSDIGSQVLGKVTNAAFAGLMSIGHATLAKMNLNIRVKDLEAGIYHECKTLDEAIGAENAIFEACQNLQGYVSTASQYNGEEMVVPIPGPNA